MTLFGKQHVPKTTWNITVIAQYINAMETKAKLTVFKEQVLHIVKVIHNPQVFKDIELFQDVLEISIYRVE